MPAPAYIVAAGLTAAAATFVFVRFVYEPHIAPALERLAEDFLERRRASRREREDRTRHLTQSLQEIPLDTRTTARAPPSSASRRPGARPGSNSSSSSSSAPAPAGAGNNAREGVVPKHTFDPTYPYPAYTSATGTGTGVGRTPEEVNEWRNAVTHHTASLRQRKSKITPAQPEGNHTQNTFFNNPDDTTSTTHVWSMTSPSSHVLDEPNHPIPQRPINPTPPRTTSSSKSTISTNKPPQHQPNPNLFDSHVSISSPSTLGLGLAPVFAVGEADESVHGSSPSTQRGGQPLLPDEKEKEQEGIVLRPAPFFPPQNGVQHNPTLINPFEPPTAAATAVATTEPSTQPTLSLSQSYPITLDQEQGIELVSNPSESEHEPSEYAFGGSEFGYSASPDRPSSPEWDSAAVGAREGAASPFIQLSPPQLPVVTLGGVVERGSVPSIRQVMERAERSRSPPSPTMFYSFTDDQRQNITQTRHSPDTFSPTLSELEFSSDDGHPSPFVSNDEFGSESSWTSARV